MIDGKSLIRALRVLLNESNSSGWMDDRTSYEYLYKAAQAFVDRTNSLRTSQAITTVADQSGYTLNANFMKLYAKTPYNDFFVKYNDGSQNTMVGTKAYEDMLYEANSTSVTVPSGFAIIDDPNKDSAVSGTTTSSGAASNGLCTLTDTGADFSDVSAGDIVHNISAGLSGRVTSVTSTTALITALFSDSGDADNNWDSGDSYMIQPQSRYQLVLDPPPSTAGHTVTVYYIPKPAPVFSPYGIYRIPAQFTDALVNLAAWLYKYADREANYGDRFYAFWEQETRMDQDTLRSVFNRRTWGVNFKKRRTR